MVSINTKKIPGLAYASVGGIVSIIIIAIILIPSLVASSERTYRNYGNTLASMAAKQAVDATLSLDLVRMHTILKNVATHPNTLLSAIYDLENNLLVQSQKPSTQLEIGETYTAAITSHESVIGYISVTLEQNDTSENSVYLFLALLTATLFAACLWSLFYYQALTWTFKKAPALPPKQNHFNKPRAETPLASTSEKNELNEKDSPLPVDKTRPTFANISITNYKTLEKQLNPATLRVILKKCEVIFTDILALYAGHSLKVEGDSFVLTFQAGEHDYQEALFRACCSAYLALELAGNSPKIPLSLSACIYQNNGSPITHNKQGKITLHKDIFMQTLLPERLNTELYDDLSDIVCIDTFKPPYRGLLEGQLQRLIKMQQSEQF